MQRQYMVICQIWIVERDNCLCLIFDSWIAIGFDVFLFYGKAMQLMFLWTNWKGLICQRHLEYEIAVDNKIPVTLMCFSNLYDKAYHTDSM